MSAEIIANTNGIVTIKISGKLTAPELAALQKSTGQLFHQQGRMRVLVLTENFEGWAKDGDWGDLSFQMEHDDDIERMAIVGERQWLDLALMFTAKGLRKFPIEYFVPADEVKARAWLAGQ
jgi:hypothetical protein